MENTPEYKWWHEESPVVLTHNGFKFKENGVCQNPEIIEIAKGKKHLFTIKVAESPEGWCTGYDYEDARNGYRGGCGAASFGKYQKTYPTREEAIEKQLKELHKIFRELFDAEIKAYLTPKPLTLF